MVLALCGLGMPTVGWAEISVTIPLSGQNNVFESGQPVSFQAEIKGAPEGKQTLGAAVTDYFGKEVWSGEIEVEGAKGAVTTPITIGELPHGYYELKIRSKGQDDGLAVATFGVAPLVDRSAKAALDGGYRFGLKMGGAPKDFDSLKAISIASRMGLQWTRERFNRENIPALAAQPLNIIYKVEMFPPEAYDAKRYGPMDEFKLRHFGWSKATVPLEEPYKKWLAGEVAKLPPEANIFEIWNEPWGKVAPEDFAKVAQMTKEAIRSVRPNAKVGPNLGHLDYDSEFIKAGGMEGLDTLVLHTYGHPERQDQAGLRGTVKKIRDYYREHLGRDVDFYVTEFGIPTPPAGPRSDATEQDQARQGVRSALALFAEDVKGFTPHWLSQTEKDPTNKENWYGYFRANGQPKPALFAMATAARMVDGQNYVGDLFLKPDVGARLFEKDGTYTLVVWANDVEVPVEVPVGVPSLQAVNVIGQESTLKTADGKLPLTANGDPVYLVGVSPELAKTASKELREDQWVTGKFIRGEREARRLKAPVEIDGKLSPQEWDGQTQIEMAIPSVDPKNVHGTARVAWDNDYLYVAVDVTDAHPAFNPYQPFSAFDGDSLEVFFCSDIKYQIPEFQHTHDAQMLFAPTSADGTPVAGVVNKKEKKLDPIPGLKMATTTSKEGWSMELAIPVATFKDFRPAPGQVCAFEVRVNDADPDRPAGKNGRFKANPSDGNPSHHDATVWSILNLVE